MTLLTEWTPDDLPGFGIEDAAGRRMELFQRIREAGRLEAMLYESSSDEESQAREWRALTDESWTLALTMPGTTGVPELAAVVLLTLFSGRSAVFHFCLMPGREGQWVSIGRNVLDWLFSTQNLTSLVGVTPACYRHVLRGLPCFGFIPRCTVPDGCYIRRRNRYYDTVISICTYKTFMEAGQ